MKNINTIIIVLCFVMLVINVVSVVWALKKNKKIEISSVITIIVTIMLGVATAIRSQQANITAARNLELNITSHTPYFIVAPLSLEEYIPNDYIFRKNESFSKDDYESFLSKSKKNFVLVNFLPNNRICLNFLLKNASNTLISNLEANIYRYDEEKNIYNKDKVVKNYNIKLDAFQNEFSLSKNALYRKLSKQHFSELFSNNWFNIHSDGTVCMELIFENNALKYKEALKYSNIYTNNDCPDALFFTVCLKMKSIYGYYYVQFIHFGLRRYGYITENKRSWEITNRTFTQVYEAEKIDSVMGIIDQNVEKNDE